MNLIIDVGNSFVKLAIIQKGGVRYKVTIELERVLEQLEVLSQTYGAFNGVIISSVGGLSQSDLEAINKRFNVFLLDYKTKLPFKNCYKTPKTLGVDRLALVSAATKHYPSSNVLIIDAGTCITYDFKNEDNSYFGGAISPGINMRYKSLHNLTANLPLLKTSMPKHITGGSTEESIHSGVIHGVLREIDGAIELYKLKYSDLTVILTGGDAKFLSKQLKSSIFANSNFLLEGLDYILQINSNE